VDITKKQLACLIDNVILKFQDKYLTKYIKTPEEKYRHDVLLTNFLVMFFDKDEQRLHKNFLDLLDFYDEIGVTHRDTKYALACLFKKYKKWVDSCFVTKKGYFKKVTVIYKNIFNNYSFQNSVEDKSDNDGDDFLFLEDMGVDSVIDDMHYEDEEKIAAEKFFETNPLDPSDLEDIMLVKEALLDLLDEHLEFSDVFLEELVSTLQKLETSLQFTFSTKDFKDMGVGVEKLVFLLQNLDEANIEENKEILYNILVTIVEDLIKWLDTIFIVQSAVDIHYLDASFLANVEQLQIVLNPVEDEDDGFLF